MFHGDPQNTGYYENEIIPPLGLIWKTKIGTSYAHPVIANKTVFVGSQSGILYAINSDTGDIKWTFDLRETNHTRRPIKSAPAIYKNIIIINSWDNVIFALDSVNGSLKWKYESKYPLLYGAHSGFFINPSPTIYKGRVYIGLADGRIHAIDIETGEEDWNFDTGEIIRSTPAIYDDILYIGSGRYLYALDAETGNLIWKKEASSDIISSPVVKNGAVYFGAENKFYSLNHLNGKVIWIYSLPTGSYIESSPAISNSAIYFSGGDWEYEPPKGNLYALDLKTGKLKWVREGYFTRISPSISGNIIYCGEYCTPSDKSRVYAINASDGSILWSYKTNYVVTSIPAFENGRVFIAGGDGYLYAFEKNYIIIDDIFVSDDRCNIGSTQTIGFHAKWSNNGSNVINGILYIEHNSQGLFKRISSGKIFYDDFNKISDKWIVKLGKWKLIDGKYFVSVGIVENGISIVRNLSPTNCVIEVTLRFLDTSVGFRTGIVFRYNDNNRHYAWDISNEYDEVAFHDYGVGTPGYGFGPPHVDTPVVSNRDYILKVIIIGNNFTGYLNGQKIQSWTDEHYKSGCIGLRARRSDVLFDEFKVYKSEYIYIKNLKSGQKVELYDHHGHIKSSGIVKEGEVLSLNVVDLNFPFKGYFKVYSTDGKTLLYTTPIYDDIWGGDVYYATSSRIKLVTDETGWAYFTDSLSSVGRRSWRVVGVDCNGVTAFEQTASSPSIIWDRVNLRLSVERSRVDVGSEAPIRVEGVYEYDGAPFQGSVVFNDSLIKNEGGRYGYRVVDISDPLYGLSVFNSNDVSVIFDRVNIKLSIDDSRIDVGESLPYSWVGEYEYDGSRFEGSITLNDTVIKDDVGRYVFTVASISDERYGLTAFSANTIDCIWDRIVIVDGGVSKEITSIGRMETVWFRALYEYDKEPFTGEDGDLYVNGEPMLWSSHDEIWKYTAVREKPGSIIFEITGVDDRKHGLTTIEDLVGPLTIEWQRPFWQEPMGIILVGGMITVVIFLIFSSLKKRSSL